MANKYNFDEVISREGSGDYKHGALLRLYGRTDLIPMWVADMDWATPPFIVDALKKRMEHPIFGYTITPCNYWTLVRKWINDHHQWDVPESWMTYIPGIVKGIGMAINVFLKEDEKVIIQPPVYHPFRLTPEGNKREVVFNPLKELPNGSYAMDFDNLEQVCDEKCKMLILSNPHNPAGIVWDKNTLQTLAHFCAMRGIIVISDEIHCDMVLSNHKHIPFAAVSEEAAQCSITFGAPSKTFNIAGIVSSYAIVSNESLRTKFYEWLEANELNEPTIFSPIASIAAYEQGEEWRQEMLNYVEGNIKLVVDFCAEHLPNIKPLVPDASFLVWLDCRDMNLDHDALIDFFVNKAHLALNDGEMFGPGGEGHMRMNVGSPRSVIMQALLQLKEVY